MEMLLGLAFLASAYAVLRWSMPRPDGSRPSHTRWPGADTVLALTFTAGVAIGLALFVQGAYELWNDSMAQLAARP